MFIVCLLCTRRCACYVLEPCWWLELPQSLYLWKLESREGAHHQIISKLRYTATKRTNCRGQDLLPWERPQNDLLCAWESDLHCNLKKGLELSEEENEGLGVFQAEAAALQQPWSGRNVSDEWAPLYPFPSVCLVLESDKDRGIFPALGFQHLAKFLIKWVAVLCGGRGEVCYSSWIRSIITLALVRKLFSGGPGWSFYVSLEAVKLKSEWSEGETTLDKA